MQTRTQKASTLHWRLGGNGVVCQAGVSRVVCVVFGAKVGKILYCQVLLNVFLGNFKNRQNIVYQKIKCQKCRYKVNQRI